MTDNVSGPGLANDAKRIRDDASPPLPGQDAISIWIDVLDNRVKLSLSCQRSIFMRLDISTARLKSKFHNAEMICKIIKEQMLKSTYSCGDVFA